jgi:flavin-dependent dehydrogenase
VIGARTAGASTALLLARKGLDVLLVDRAKLPCEIPHGHFIHRAGPARLARWGLLEPLLADGCPAVTESTFDFGELRLSASDVQAEGVPLGLGPRRARVDAVLADAAVAAGAELRTGFAVEDVLRDGERVTGVRARDGTREQAALVIGADGRNSPLAKRVGAPLVEDGGQLSVWYFSYWSGVPGAALEIYVRDERGIFAFPTNDGLFAVFVAWPVAELPRVKADPEAAMLAVLDLVPELAERVRGGSREERIYGATQLPNLVRRPYGPGWSLVGDAACHKDPFLALGMCDALRDAELLADAVADGLGAGRLDDALAAYGREHDEATRPDYEENLAAAHLQPPTGQAAALIAALQGREEDTWRFVMARERLAPPESFFNPDTLGRLLS